MIPPSSSPLLDPIKSTIFSELIIHSDQLYEARHNICVNAFEHVLMIPKDMVFCATL